MKYNIEGFDQQHLVDMGLNANDAIILRWFVDFYATGKMAVVKDQSGDEYKWVKYQAIIDDLPILEIKNKQVIARHFAKMEKSGIIKKYVHRKGGTFSCFKLTDKFRVLIEKYNPIDSKVETPIDSEVETKDSSIKINSSIKNTCRTPKKRKKKEFVQPTLKDVINYISEKKYNVDANKFYRHYNDLEWKDIYGNKVVSWKSKVSTWHDRNEKEEEKNKQKETPVAEQEWKRIEREEKERLEREQKGV